ncbi:MAG TPA: hypothetical protein VNT01_11235 [Symbiobacteriaceae bacterium]|nr:hypothetical protein [Symbiobacteriaceae bacterium]
MSLVFRDITRSVRPEWQTEQTERYAACPEAARFTDEEAEEFLFTAHVLDGLEHSQLSKWLRKAGVTIPTALMYDHYRIGRYLLHRWAEPVLRQSLLAHMPSDDEIPRRAMRRRKVSEMLAMVDQYGPVTIFAWFRLRGAAELIPPIRSAWSPVHEASYMALLRFAKLTLHRFLTEPEPPPRPTRWDQEKLASRMHVRDVQLRAMRKSVHALHGERKALLGRLREATRQENPELHALAAELELVRAERAALERRHAQARADLANSLQTEIAALNTQLLRNQDDYARAVAARVAWLPPAKGGQA